MALVLLLLLLLLLLSILILFYLHRNSKARQIPPGPPGLPIIGNLHQFINSSTSPHIHLLQLSKKYGPMFSMQLGSVPLLIVSSSEIAKQVLKTHDHVFSSRPGSLGRNRLSYNSSDVAFAPYTESWRELRKICVVHLLSSKRVQSFRDIREDEVLGLIESLSEKANSGQVVNLSTTMLYLTSTLICRVAFGNKRGEGVYLERLDELMVESQEGRAGFFFSDYLPWLGWLDRISGMMDRLDKVCKDLDRFYNDLINDHLNPTRIKPEYPDMLDILIRLKEENSCSIQITWDHIKAILMNIFIAATDTSAAVVVWAMMALIKKPAAMNKLQREIRGQVGDQGKVSEDDLLKLPFLKAVVKEALRLYTPAPLLIPRQTLEWCTIRGYEIPPKTITYINAWAIARDPECWESPEEFIPERFLNSDVDITGQDFRVIPFGAGRRGCPGIAMGLVNVEMVLANLIYAFDWELPNGIKMEDIDEEVLPGLTMHKKNRLLLVPKNYLQN